ncbi:hypothetical protein SeMB42_g04492 [Synchytrium endobioticum]|uniref:Uncharacterized protein n=1 Tax=Synchytrium endobioticum TaxID=286115 RepID=A0A507CXY7_9FUNG|nr:hypothetical protein SeMB42_g04492 [Synchytrium endobioticum]
MDTSTDILTSRRSKLQEEVPDFLKQAPYYRPSCRETQLAESHDDLKRLESASWMIWHRTSKEQVEKLQDWKAPAPSYSKFGGSLLDLLSKRVPGCKMASVQPADLMPKRLRSQWLNYRRRHSAPATSYDCDRSSHGTTAPSGSDTVSSASSASSTLVGSRAHDSRATFKPTLLSPQPLLAKGSTSEQEDEGSSGRTLHSSQIPMMTVTPIVLKTLLHTAPSSGTSYKPLSSCPFPKLSIDKAFKPPPSKGLLSSAIADERSRKTSLQCLRERRRLMQLARRAQTTEEEVVGGISLSTYEALVSSQHKAQRTETSSSPSNNHIMMIHSNASSNSVPTVDSNNKLEWPVTLKPSSNILLANGVWEAGCPTLVDPSWRIKENLARRVTRYNNEYDDKGDNGAFDVALLVW